ncbi:MAG: NADH-quinone oxidoreductase subunit G [Gammaproteobacteria bacterium]|nr:MAG: NADH-quinone oxidoreductase subunit G [Gammaproteobacteria bacterium]
MVNIEIDGNELQVPAGTMLIDVADEAGIYIPRFCYHHKLSVAANCRMCLVEVEKAPKPMPACATPVADGMKVSTRSGRAKDAQRNVMEFLLINHPLDCPICDQGGECELQDIAMGFGRDVSAFAERKRVVTDKDIGPLIATEMTRCILCTRCVRFGEEIAGLRELGATGRGMHTEIGTYVGDSVDHELSGNVIDLCPVGALTAKPSRYQSRAWEVSQTPSIAAHDAVGSNTYIHTLRNRVIRVVPRDNEGINEVWISDRDRFSYEGVMHEDRIAAPMINRNGKWETTDWEQALNFALDGINRIVDAKGPDSLGTWVSPRATMEEMYLLQQIVRHLGSQNIDHRLRQQDFRAQDAEPLFPSLGVEIKSVESMNSILVVGSNIRKEQPIIAHHVRKAARNGADISFINPRTFDLRFDAQQVAVHPGLMAAELAAVAIAMNAKVPSSFMNVEVTDAHKSMADSLKNAEQASVMLGQLTLQHPDYALIRYIAAAIADAAGCQLGFLPEAANTAGAWQAGILPHRGPGGASIEQTGKNFQEMVESIPSAMILHDVEPAYDCASPEAASALIGADFVVACTPFVNESIKDYADVILPIVPITENEGTFVNMEGLAQSFQAAVKPYAESRPAWKVYRVISNLLGIDGCDYQAVNEVQADVLQASAASSFSQSETVIGLEPSLAVDALVRCGEVTIYSTDSLVRRAVSLQQTEDARLADVVMINQSTASSLGLNDVQRVIVSQGEMALDLECIIDDGIADNTIWLAMNPEMGSLYQPVEIKAS